MFGQSPRTMNGTPMPAEARRWLWRALFFGVLLGVLWIIMQQTALPDPAEAPSVAVRDVPLRPRPASSGLFSFGTLAVFVVLAGGAGLAFFLRRRAQEREAVTLPLQSLGALPLAPNQQLRLIRCGDDVLLLGVTPGQITLLKTYEYAEGEAMLSDPPEAFAAAQPAMPPEDPLVSTENVFAMLLRQQVGRTLNVQKTQAPC